MATVTIAGNVDETGPFVSDEIPYEVIDGRVIERPDMGAYQNEVATILSTFLAPYAREKGLGRVIVEILVRVDPKTQYRPDLAYVSYDRWAKTRRLPDTDPWDIIPDLAIEVISKNDRAVSVMEKVRHYFQVGTRSVWLVYPTLQLIHVYWSYSQIRVFNRDEVLDGGEILPGFQLPLSSLFEELSVEDEPAN